ncbi:MAG TPA: hypothetical protein VEW46_15075 [Pyrinomonadaceae bacterium]|nr:hypothetical protein [Pyrinomonadaceae bacterium]
MQPVTPTDGPQSPPDNVSSNLPRSSKENSSLENSGQQPNKTKQTTRSGIRQVNFRNFTYPWYPKSLTPPLRRREITLHNGNFEIGLEARQGITPITVDLEHVLYADLTQDGEEDALVYLAGSVPTNSFLANLLVYTIDNGILKVLWQHETGDRGNGGLRAFKVADSALIVEEYDPKVNPEQSLCCPKNFSRSSFRWTYATGAFSDYHLAETALDVANEMGTRITNLKLTLPTVDPKNDPFGLWSDSYHHIVSQHCKSQESPSC